MEREPCGAALFVGRFDWPPRLRRHDVRAQNSLVSGAQCLPLPGKQDRRHHARACYHATAISPREAGAWFSLVAAPGAGEAVASAHALPQLKWKVCGSLL